jgi:hypothetical protein
MRRITMRLHSPHRAATPPPPRLAATLHARLRRAPVFVDGQAARVPQLLLWSAGCYAATALFYSAKAALQDFFAWRWRAALTLRLQRQYCAAAGAHCGRTRRPALQVRACAAAAGPWAAAARPRAVSSSGSTASSRRVCVCVSTALRLRAQHVLRTPCTLHARADARTPSEQPHSATQHTPIHAPQRTHQGLDSPDQRMAQDLPLLTASLAEVLTQLAAVPFNIVWYSHLTHQVRACDVGRALCCTALWCGVV